MRNTFMSHVEASIDALNGPHKSTLCKSWKIARVSISTRLFYDRIRQGFGISVEFVSFRM